MLEDTFSPLDFGFGFPSLGYHPKSWTKNLGVLLYIGGAAVHPRSANQLIADGSLGQPQLNRLPLIVALHKTLLAFIDASHGGEADLKQRLFCLKMLFRFADRNGKSITIDSVTNILCAWTDSLIRRTHLADEPGYEYDRDCGPLSPAAAYSYCGVVARILTVALARDESILALASIRTSRVHQLTVDSMKKNHVAVQFIDETQSALKTEASVLHEVFVDLTFNGVDFGQKAIPWNLNILLYRGGAAANARVVQRLIHSGALGSPLYERLRLVCGLHEELTARLAAGGSPHSTNSCISSIKRFFKFADQNGFAMSMEAVVTTFCMWTDSLVERTQFTSKISHPNDEQRGKPLAANSAYAIAADVGGLLNEVLERHTHILELTRLKPPKQRETAIGVDAEKQNLSHTLAFGHFLQDICDTLTIEAVRTAPLPIVISLRSGKVISCEGSRVWARMDQATGLGERYRLANLRIEAELCMFIGQTGMNLAQAHELTLRRFFYVGHIDSYQVRDHKKRRNGPVLFEIFKEYKFHFERYLEWRRTFFPNSERLFPLIKEQGTLPNAKFVGYQVKVACKQANVKYIPPQTLRGTRVNWLLRKTADPDTTAEIAQHTKETLLNVYHRPSHQRALGEAISFWRKTDPSLIPTEAAAPGDCDGEKPQQVGDAPRGAPAPDCRRASGCLWCLNHKDVDSFDYVWALVTFKHLKIIELSTGPIPKRGDENPPAKLVIDRVDEKLRAFEESNEQRRDWVIEAQSRIEEEDFHPSFKDEIAALEGEA